MAKDPGRVLIFDTTLRDGEQSPGASLNLEEKLAIAQQLARLGVDVIEAGFPFASPGDFAAVQKIAEQVGGVEGPIICGLSRASKPDIKACAEAIAPAPIPLSMLTTDKPSEQLCSIDANAATPFSPYPCPTEVGTPITGTLTVEETTDANAPSIPAATIITSTSALTNSFKIGNVLCNPAIPIS